MSSKLPVKLKRFQKELIDSVKRGVCLSPTEIAMQVYDCKDRLSARVIASQNLSKLNITMVDLMDRMGLSDEQDINDLIRLRKATKPISCNVFIKQDGEMVDAGGTTNDFIEIDDNATQLKALELTFKLKGHLKNNHNNGNVNVATIIFNIGNSNNLLSKTETEYLSQKRG